MKKEQPNVASLEPNVDSLRSNVASKEPQNLAWACLPKEARNQIRDIVKTSGMGIHGMFDLVFGGNVTSDVEPEEMLMISRKRVQDYYSSYSKESANIKNNEPYLQFCEGRLNAITNLFGDKCLPDKEESKPKCDIGQKVKIKGTKQIGTIKEPYSNDNDYRVYFEDGDGGWDEEYSAEDLEPYTEESRNLSQNIANCDKSEDNKLKDNMEGKELNLGELLKGCEGEKIYLPDEGECEIVSVAENEIELSQEPNRKIILSEDSYIFTRTGFAYAYPSKESFLANPLNACKAWQGWKEARKPKRWRAEYGETYYSLRDSFTVCDQYENNDSDNDCAWNNYNYFRTEEEAKQAAEEVKECLMKFHEKNAGRDI